MKWLVFFSAFLSLSASGIAETVTPNWTGNYGACNRHSELLNLGHMSLGVRFSTSNTALAQEFEHALDFWSTVVDLEWHSVDSSECSIALVDGSPALFDWCACTSARSQLPDRPQFEGLVAFNPRLKLSRQEMFLDSVHEIGHLLGLVHNPSETSIMYFFGLDKFEWLEPSDLSALQIKHSLKPGFLLNHGIAKLPVVAPTKDEHTWINPVATITPAH